MAAPFVPVTFPFKLSSTDPNGVVESCRLLDDRIVEVHYMMALLLGLPMDTDLATPVNLGTGLLGTIGQDCRWLNGATLRMKATSVLVGDTQTLTKINNPGPIDVNILVAGPVANGRDQVAMLPANSFVHFYWIYHPTTLEVAGIGSLTLPSLGGPNLPSGFVLGAYAGAMRIGPDNNMLQANLRGRWTQYHTIHEVFSFGVPSFGTNILVDCSAVVPPNAVGMRCSAGISAPPTSVPDIQPFSVKDGLGDFCYALNLGPHEDQVIATFEVPNFDQHIQFDYPPSPRGPAGLGIQVTAFENEGSNS